MWVGGWVAHQTTSAKYGGEVAGVGVLLLANDSLESDDKQGGHVGWGG